MMIRFLAATTWLHAATVWLHTRMLPTIGLGSAVSLVVALLVGTEASAQSLDSLPIGTFEDDYGARHVVTDSTWQHSSSVYRVVSWHPDTRQVVLAGVSDAGAPLWMRIDWLVFDDGADVGSRVEGEPPWTWAYCMAVWDAPSASTARQAPVSDRGDPRGGCGEGFPFSRMRQGPPQDRPAPAAEKLADVESLREVREPPEPKTCAGRYRL